MHLGNCVFMYTDLYLLAFIEEPDNILTQLFIFCTDNSTVRVDPSSRSAPTVNHVTQVKEK